MCDHSGKLMAWLDHELDGGEMAEIERHVHECVECEARVSQYTRMAEDLGAYYATRAANALSKPSRFAPVLSVAAAAIVVTALAWYSLRPHNPRPDSGVPPAISGIRPVIAPEVTSPPARRKTMPARRVVPRMAAIAAAPSVNWLPPEPAIEVAIPAESMFPPGAVPEGVSFVADVSFGPDGSPQQIRLQPRMTGLERKTIQP